MVQRLKRWFDQEGAEFEGYADLFSWSDVRKLIAIVVIAFIVRQTISASEQYYQFTALAVYSVVALGHLPLLIKLPKLAASRPGISGVRDSAVLVAFCVPLSFLTFFSLWGPIVALSSVQTQTEILSYIRGANLSILSYEPVALTVLLVVVVAPVLEELIFRGVLFAKLAQTIGAFWSMTLSSLLFAVLHIDIIGGFLFGMALCVLVVRTGSLRYALFVHIGVNFTAIALEAFDRYWPGYLAPEDSTLMETLFWWPVYLSSATVVLLIALSCWFCRYIPFRKTFQ